MSLKIAIINCYADEPKSAPSAKIFTDNILYTMIINHCHGEKIDNISQFDGYIISGSRSCHKDRDEWIIELQQLIKDIHEKDIPCLAVCFGHQLVAYIFGGTTVINLASEEGFQDVQTKMGEDTIKLFAGLSNPVKVYQSHNDAVMKAPPGSIDVVCNDKCVQYYQFGSVYSIQSHPEIDIAAAKRLAERDDKEIKAILNGVNEQNIKSDKILKNFSKIVESTIQY
ncbi:MAG: type 1 glutamine amidotransferase [Candidatus Marinimicrobia bacterium]|nr:type 1 glutamine amidotransferase [Candidatus Neomarinimicrobiota bacterium]